MGEAGLKAEMLVRGTRVAYKKCPSCRALVPRAARRCTECGATLAGVRAPGLTRVVANLIPGATATTFFLLAANTCLFAVVLLLPVRLETYEPASPMSRLWNFDWQSLVRYGGGFSADDPERRVVENRHADLPSRQVDPLHLQFHGARAARPVGRGRVRDGAARLHLRPLRIRGGAAASSFATGTPSAHRARCAACSGSSSSTGAGSAAPTASASNP